jgi:hypothetical protein
MNNEEAKFILQGYRPNGADANDATFCAAVEQAKNDPLLGEWFAKQQAFDAAISSKLGQIVPPADLRAAILAGGRVTAGAAERRSWWNRPAWLAFAAGVAVVFATGLALWPKRAAAFDEFALADSRFGATHGHGARSEATDSLQATLSQPTTKLGQKLPVNFATLLGTGCRHVSYRGREVLEVCFNRNGEWFHCYIGRRSDFPRVAQGQNPVILEKNGGAIAMWTDAEHVIVVVSKVGRKSLEALL